MPPTLSAVALFLSMGGAVSAQFASVYPKKCASLTLIAAVGTRAMKMSPIAKLLSRWVPFVSTLAAHFMLSSGSLASSYEWEDHKNCAHFDEYVALEGPRPTREPALKRAVSLSIVHFPFDACEHCYEEIGNWTRDSEVSSGEKGQDLPPHMPVLVLHGEKDKTVPFKSAERICRLIPHAKLKAYESAAHLLPVERPVEVASELLEFWAGR